MGRTIIHVDMDAFYAAVEVRDNPDLVGKPLIIGSLPHERGVVSTCSYEARTFGVRSAMSIKEAYRRCPDGIYMHPNMAKYKAASESFHAIWNDYTDIVEYVSLDEGYLDVTGSLQMFGSAEKIALDIKTRTRRKVGLTCSVGIGYSMSSAKLASEEKKPDGLFVIPDAEALLRLIDDRGVRVIFGVGQRTAEKLNAVGIYTVRDIRHNRQKILDMFGKQGEQIVSMADGIDNRKVTPYYEAEAKSIGREHTFQTDITDRNYLKSVLRLITKELSTKIRMSGLYCQTITLKVTYADMRGITRSKTGATTNRAEDIYSTAAVLLDGIERAPIRLIGISISNFTSEDFRQLSISDLGVAKADERKEQLDEKMLDLQKRFGSNILKTGTELNAERQIKDKE